MKYSMEECSWLLLMLLHLALNNEIFAGEKMQGKGGGGDGGEGGERVQQRDF